MSKTNEYCTFHVGAMFFGVEVRRVQEVIRYQAMTPVPLGPAEVAGLINLRGQIVTAVDLRKRLGLPERADGKLPMNVVIQTEDGAVSLLVDEIGDVLPLGQETYEPAPETLSGVARDVITGVHKLDKHLMLIMDTRAVLMFDKSGIAEAA